MQLLSLRKFICFLFVLALAACGEQEKSVTKDEALQMARSLEGSLKRRSAAKFNEAFDADALADRVSKAGKVKIVLARGVAEGVKKGQMGTELINSMGKGGSYELVKQYEKDNKQHLIFRLFGEDGKVNYHDLELVKKKDQIKIADMFVYLSGENLSTTLAQALALMGDHYDGMSKEEKEQIGNIKSIRKLLNAGKYEAADDLYEKLPEVLKSQKMFRVIRVEIASGLSNESYAIAMEELEKAYPNAPNMFLMKIDAYILKKDYKGALKSINQLDSLINKDAFLDYYRGLVCKMDEDVEGQRLYFERLVAGKPEFAAGVLELIFFYMDNNEKSKAAELTKKYKELGNVGKDQMDGLYTVYPELEKLVG
ncbi:hypothetical protein HHL16_00370 [Pseudoflavitalea sp. G-6-1-2]|uniref:tetratricopeptide repeat protein n=1 Tax=Pseudoflavitalea sp. G-6-1-2 TaxID=2728841 RepID=UPI00146F5714|nr:hypothetical protein [Pseudoflavitalea sp. G-6-1-2]NML19299.1 hypothetical protein [Pseudoflavitalea sp. G-6-1-2]